MDIAIPRNNASELLLYIWKIIDIPNISKTELLYKISFKLFLFSPQKAKNFINLSLKKKLITKNEFESISLSQNLMKTLNEWQIGRKKDILKKINQGERKHELKVEISTDALKSFKTLLNAFIDKGTLNRAASLSNSGFDINTDDIKEGIIKVKVVGAKSKSYHIEINTKNKLLNHDCLDFLKNRAINKKFCKHIVKLFLILKEKKEDNGFNILRNIGENINDWEFSN